MPELKQIISYPQMAILNSTKPVNLFLAGVGSGKTFLGGIITYRYITQFPECIGFVATNTFEQLNLSTLFRIREYWKSLGVTEWSKENPNGTYVAGKKPPTHFNRERHNFDSYNSIISFINGAIIFTGSLENSTAHEGKQFSYAILDETKDSRESDVKEIIIARLRQQGLYIKNGKLSHEGEDFNPLYILTSPAKTDWLSEWFELDKYLDEISAKIYSDKTYFEKEFGNKFITISSTYHNQRNLPSNYIDNIKNNNTEERFRALVYANPFTLTGGEFYSSFDRLKHVDKLRYNPELPLHLSFDQNTVPYNSCSIWQIVQKEGIWHIHCVDEIALQNPRNSTEEVCEEFGLRYASHKAGIYYYGDASGKSRSTMNKDFRHHYEIISYKLKKYLMNGSDRTTTHNPSVVKRRDFVNLIFEGKLPIHIMINESCKHLVADCMYLKQAIDGTKDKSIVTDRETGEKYQKYGHLSDGCFVGNTKILTDSGEVNIKDIKIGDFVLTRKGYRKVINKINKGFQIIYTYKIGNKIIECTPDHKIFTNNNFFMVETLINTNIFTIFVEKKSWIDKLLLMVSINFIGTQARSQHQKETITEDGYSKTNGANRIFTGLFGNLKRVKYQKDLQFITLMVILTIIRLRITTLLLWQNTLSIITKYLHRITRTGKLQDFLTLLSQHQRHGMGQQKAGNGIAFMQNRLSLEKSREEYVLSVIKSLILNLKNSLSIAVEDVRAERLQERHEKRVNTLNYGSVGSAENHFQLTSGERIASVHAFVQKVGDSRKQVVYDITVSEESEFFANGILVHNCDYLLTELFKAYYNG